MTNLGTLGGALLGVSNISTLGALGFAYNAQRFNDFHDVYAVARNLAGLIRLPFDFNAAPYVTVASTSTTLPDAHVASGNVSIINPDANTQLSGTQTIEASTSVVVSKVTLWVDGTEQAGQVSVPPYRFSLNTSTLSQGPHVLAVAAYDKSQQPTYSSPLPVTVSAGFTSCTGQPYDQVLSLEPGKTDLKASPGSLPTTFRLLHDSDNFWHLCGYPAFQGSYNILGRSSTSNRQAKSSGIL